MRPLINREQCFGCMACVDICSQDAIKAVLKHDGFYYPYVDTDRCINCKMCEQVCPARSSLDIRNNSKIYAVKAKNKQIQTQSQSGGAGFIIASEILKQGGIVYGVKLDDALIARHVRVENISELYALQGSKYVQSNTVGIYRQIKKDLINKKKVVFFGTPCQCLACKKYFKGYKDLYIVDIICHGVPSPQIWKSNIELLEKKYKSHIVNAEFRDKTMPWGKSVEKYVFADGRIVNSTEFLKLFYSNSFTRLCCAVCKFSNTDRVGDVSIGDFWGCELVTPEMNDEIGVSLVFANTETGEELFRSIQDEIEFKKIVMSDAVLKNEPLNKPAGKSRFREIFVWTYKFFGMRGLIFLNKISGIL